MYPFGSFSESAQAVLQSAQEEAWSEGRGYIGTEHVVLALARDEQGAAGRILTGLGVTYEALKAKVDEVVHRPADPRAERPLPTTRVKKVVELAFREATEAGQELVNTEHLLLALLVEAEGVGAHALGELGVTLPRVRDAVRAASGDPGPAPAAGAVGLSSSLTMAMMRAGQLAQEEAADIRADHMLRAMAQSEMSDLRGVLRRLGLAPEAVQQELAVPEEVRRLGVAVRAARGGGDSKEAQRLSQEHSEAVSRWLEGTA